MVCSYLRINFYRDHMMKSPLSILTFALLFTLPASLTGTERKGMNIPTEHTQKTMAQVADWQINNFTYKTEGNLHDYGIDAWTNSVLYIGMLKWAQAANAPTPYLDWLMKIGTDNKWSVPANFADYPKYKYYHADELCIGQFYLSMYDRYKKEDMLRATQERLDWIMGNPADTSMKHANKQCWTWCDALFMAPPVYAQLSKTTGNPKYLAFMHKNFLLTYNHLYDRNNHLFFRDDSYFDKKEANGKKVFWGRGNGWVLAGIANILDLLPPNSELKPFYEKLFVELAVRLSQLQDKDGFWHASLLDPGSYPSPETSSSALITYGLAYGLNHQLLDASFLPVVEKAWAALLSTVDKDGKVGWVQPIGADPKKVTRDMTAVFGVGAFLMAGTEIMKLSK